MQDGDHETGAISQMLHEARRQLHEIDQAIGRHHAQRATVVDHITYLQQQQPEVLASALPPRQEPGRRSHALASRRVVTRSNNDLATVRRLLDDADKTP